MTTPKTVDLDAIEARAAAARICIACNACEHGHVLTRTDVPAMAAELRELRAKVAEEREMHALTQRQFSGVATRCNAADAALEKAQAEAGALREALETCEKALTWYVGYFGDDREGSRARAALAKVQP